MSASVRSLAAGIVTATWLALSSTSLAASPDGRSSEAASEARRNEARRQFQRGAQLYRSEQYREAVSAFLEADRLAPSPALSFNIARAYERLEDTSGALRWYRDYLRRSPNAKNAAEVKARIAELAARLAQSGLQQLTVLSTPSSATVVIDGRAVGVTPFTGDLAPGRHRVLLDREGYLDAARDVVLSARQPLDLELALEPEPRAAPGNIARGTSPKPAASRRANGSETRFGAVPWVVAGAGVATLGGAAGFELARRSQESSARSADSQLEFKQYSDAMQRDQTRARVAAGVGGVLLATGGVMLLVNAKEPEATRVGVGCTLRGCSASAHGTF